MGADWYNCTALAALGFIVSEQDWPAISATLAQLGSDNLYRFVSYVELCDENKSASIGVFVYDMRTVTRNMIDMVGPYNIEPHYCDTDVTRNDDIAQLFGTHRDWMRTAFVGQNVSYYLINTCFSSLDEGVHPKQLRSDYGLKESDSDGSDGASDSEISEQ